MATQPGVVHPDWVARETALRYAVRTMRFIRTATSDWDHSGLADAWYQKQDLPYHGHIGKPPLRIDAEAQQYLESVVRQEQPPEELGEVLLLGEEVAHANWDPHSPGPVSIIRCDPVDGTSPLAHTGQGFASVVTVESRRDSGHPWSHLGGAIVRSDGRAISWSRTSVQEHHVPFEVRGHSPDAELPAITDLGTMPSLASRAIKPEHRQIIAHSGAAVAAQSKKRRQELLRRYGSLINEAEYFDFQGGNPTAWPLCEGLLGWTIELNPTTIHDSIYLWPFKHLGGTVVDEYGNAMDILSLIEEHAGPEALEKAVPPYISYIYEESLEFIMSRRSGLALGSPTDKSPSSWMRTRPANQPSKPSAAMLKRTIRL